MIFEHKEFRVKCDYKDCLFWEKVEDDSEAQRPVGWSLWHAEPRTIVDLCPSHVAGSALRLKGQSDT